MACIDTTINNNGTNSVVNRTEMEQEPSIDTDKLSYEIFSILETKFLFGYEDQKLYIPQTLNPNPNPNNISIKNQRGKICILSVDAAANGLLPGILSGKALSHLENSLRSKSGNPEARIADYFDVVAGSGVGGIFAAMLFATKDHRRPIFQAADTWKFLVDHSKKFRSSSSAGGFVRRLFSPTAGGSSGSSTCNLEKFLKESLTDKSRFLTLKDTLKPVLIPCYDLSTSAPFLFSRADALETDSFDFRLWEVCRATSAEPGSFEPVMMRSVDGRTGCLGVDGGLVMSNPTAAAITHVLHNKQEFPFVRGVEDLLVLSLGTGQVLEVRGEYEDVRKWKIKDWARPMKRISGDGSAEMVDHAVAMAFGQSRSSNYVRIQSNGSSLSHCGPNVNIDSSLDNVNALVVMAEEMLKQKNVESVLFGGKRISEQSNSEKLDSFAGELVQEHQRRSCRIAPTVAFKEAASKPK